MAGVFTEPRKSIHLLESGLQLATVDEPGLNLCLSDAVAILTGKEIALKPETLGTLRSLPIGSMSAARPSMSATRPLPRSGASAIPAITHVERQEANLRHRADERGWVLVGAMDLLVAGRFGLLTEGQDGHVSTMVAKIGRLLGRWQKVTTEPGTAVGPTI